MYIPLCKKMRLGFRTRIELPSCITKDYKYLVVDATPHGMNDFINPYNESQNEERKQKCQQKRKEVIAGLNTLIGQLTSLLEYYNIEERKKVEEDIDRFVKKNHMNAISSPTYQPTLWDDPMTIHRELKRKQRDEEVADFVRSKFKGRMRVE
tara:strand:+ start:70 stop:525 length:456 start_codon:yes stop_codon:yes gene_type:complete